MAKMVCVNCHVEFRPEKNGTIVIETASFGPYKIWEADTWKCPKCNVEVVCGFGQQPIAEHWYQDFQERMQRVCEGARVEYDNEYRGD